MILKDRIPKVQYVTKLENLQNFSNKGDIFGYISGSVACGVMYIGRSTNRIFVS